MRVERADGVATITIDRPPVNAMSRAVVEALESMLGALATDASTRVAVLRGAGPRGFSAGADISEFPALLEPNADRRGEGIGAFLAKREPRWKASGEGDADA